jgi:aminomethyltransferase
MGERFDYFVPDDLPIYADKKKIGKITSSIYSPRLNKNIGLAMLDTKINEDLKKITLKFNNKISEVQICSLPFLRNK